MKAAEPTKISQFPVAHPNTHIDVITTRYAAHRNAQPLRGRATNDGCGDRSQQPCASDNRDARQRPRVEAAQREHHDERDVTEQERRQADDELVDRRQQRDVADQAQHEGDDPGDRGGTGASGQSRNRDCADRGQRFGDQFAEVAGPPTEVPVAYRRNHRCNRNDSESRHHTIAFTMVLIAAMTRRTNTSTRNRSP